MVYAQHTHTHRNTPNPYYILYYYTDTTAIIGNVSKDTMKPAKRTRDRRGEEKTYRIHLEKVYLHRSGLEL